MQGINRIILFGRIGSEPELRRTGKGKAVCRLGIAVPRAIRKDDGWEEEVEWFNVTVWEQQAETVCRLASRGAACLVEGRLSNNHWEDAQGQKHRDMDVVADRVHFVGGVRPAGGQRREGRRDAIEDDASEASEAEAARSAVAMPAMPAFEGSGDDAGVF
jgi:single-strand DNA-binding protein